jgi:hypothetical protein
MYICVYVVLYIFHFHYLKGQYHEIFGLHFFSLNWSFWNPDSWVKNHFADQFIFVKPFKFNVFCRCGIQRKRFFSVVGYNGRVFFHCGIQWRRFSSVVGYNRRGFFPLWDTTENNLRMANKFFSIVSHNAGSFSSVVSYTTTKPYAVYCIPEKSSTLYPTTPQVFFRCIPQWKIFSSIVVYNGRGFFSLWDTTEEAFLHYGIQRKRFFSILGYNIRGFFPLWDTIEKNYTTRNDIFKF